MLSRFALPAAFFAHNAQLWIALLVTLLFALAARWMRGVTAGGAVAGLVIAFLLYAACGVSTFIMLVVVFALTWSATRWGYARKLQHGTAERRDGRDTLQVMSNLGVAGICAGLYAWRADPLWLVGLTAALAEAAADTVSSEVGQATSDTAVLITSWKEVPAGTDGGVSVAGTLAGVGAAASVGLVSLLANLIGVRGLCIALGAATFGIVADSFLGASLERRGILSNNAVNCCGTASAACLATVIARLAG